MSSTIALVMFAVIIGFIVYLFWRQNRIFDDIQKFYKANGMLYQETPPVEHPFIYTDVKPICSKGNLKPDMPFTFMLGSRAEGAGQSRILHTYIGVFIPNHPRLTDSWLSTWKQKVAERGDNWAQHSGIQPIEKSWGLMGPPENLPIVAKRFDNGIVIAWSGLHIRKVMEARLDELKQTLN
ncbi:MAG: hypothetical protein U0X74_00175 [Anaerolineales bacterium]